MEDSPHHYPAIGGQVFALYLIRIQTIRIRKIYHDHLESSIPKLKNRFGNFSHALVRGILKMPNRGLKCQYKLSGIFGASVGVYGLKIFSGRRALYPAKAQSALALRRRGMMENDFNAS